MENLKPLSEVLCTDFRNCLFVRFDTLEPLTINEHHAEVAAITLDLTVPAEIRSYFATIQNVYLYAWFAYDLYSVAQLLCLTAVEMALRKRLPYEGKGADKRGLQNLMDQAVSKNLVREKSFSDGRRIRKNLADHLRLRRFMGKFPKSAIPRLSYVADLKRSIPSARNALAHPSGQWIFAPDDALSQIRRTSELINQLFAT